MLFWHSSDIIRPPKTEKDQLLPSSSFFRDSIEHTGYGASALNPQLDILVSRQVDGGSGIEAIINPSRRAIVPEPFDELRMSGSLRPHPAFLAWHREYCFKQ